MLKELFNSLERTTQHKQQLCAWIYVDDDDEITRNFVDTQIAANYTFEIHWHIGNRTTTQGEMVNVLRNVCGARSGIYMPVPDDYVFATHHWDSSVREVFDRYPDRVLLAYPDEATAASEQVTLIILSAEWSNITGEIVTNYFPFWFDDIWLDQVAQMIQRKSKVPFDANPQGNKGKTIRMRNLLFWQRFFYHTLDERILQADQLRQVIYAKQPQDYEVSIYEGARLAAQFQQQMAPIDIEAIIYTENNFASDNRLSLPSTRYLKAEQNAILHLFQKAIQNLKDANIVTAQLIIEDIGYAEKIYNSIHALRSLCAWIAGDQKMSLRHIKEEMMLQGDSQIIHEIAELIEQPVEPATKAESIRLLSQLRPLPVADNPNRILTPRGLRGQLRLALMPVLLRLKVVISMLRGKPIHQWGGEISAFWNRYWRRRTN